MPLTARELQQVDAAISAHGKWLTQLKIAIEDGTSQFDPENVRADNRCDFGKWLYGDFPKEAKNTPVFDEMRAKHAAFHRTAAHILQLALAGHKQEALKSMDYQGEFMQLSGELILMLKMMRTT